MQSMRAASRLFLSSHVNTMKTICRFVSFQKYSKFFTFPSIQKAYTLKIPFQIMTNEARKLSTNRLPFDNITNLSKDMLLYSYEKAKFFKYLGICGLFQLALWLYWGQSLYSNLRDIKSTSSVEADTYISKHPLWRRINLGEKKYRITAFTCCLAIGSFTAFILFALPSRIVRSLVLCKGGQRVNIVTYGAFGKTRQLNVPLSHLSSQSTRQAAKSYISLKLKGKWMFFLLDCRGQFTNPELFDYTVGTSSATKL